MDKYCHLILNTIFCRLLTGPVSVEESSKIQLHKYILELVNIKENWIIKPWIQGTEEVVIAKPPISQLCEEEETTYFMFVNFFLKN